MENITIPFNVLWNIAQGVSALLIMFGAFVMNKMSAEQKAMQAEITALQKEISDHRLLSSEKYEERSTVQSGLARVHERMDKFREDMDKKIDNLGNMMSDQFSSMQNNIIAIVNRNGARHDP